MVQTPSEDYKYDHFWIAPHDYCIGFSAMACSDVYVALSEIPGVFEDQMYEIVIGGWDNSKYASLEA